MRRTSLHPRPPASPRNADPLPPPPKPSTLQEYTVQNFHVTNRYLLPLRQACAGGIPVLVSASVGVTPVETGISWGHPSAGEWKCGGDSC